MKPVRARFNLLVDFLFSRFVQFIAKLFFVRRDGGEFIAARFGACILLRLPVMKVSSRGGLYCTSAGVSSTPDLHPDDQELIWPGRLRRSACLRRFPRLHDFVRSLLTGTVFFAMCSFVLDAEVHFFNSLLSRSILLVLHDACAAMPPPLFPYTRHRPLLRRRWAGQQDLLLFRSIPRGSHDSGALQGCGVEQAVIQTIQGSDRSRPLRR